MIEAAVILHYMVLYSTSDDQGVWVSSITLQTMELRIVIDVQVSPLLFASLQKYHYEIHK
jgi:hypothetical protein